MIVANPIFVTSASAVAVSVTLAGFGAVAGAVYVTALVVAPLSIPQAAPLQPAPLSDQETPRLSKSLGTVAVKFCVVPTSTVGLAGEIETVIAGSTVTVAVPLRVGSATEVAVTVTAAGEGTLAGAVYNPLVEIVPQAAPLHPAPLSVHVTPLFNASLLTVAANCFVFVTFTEPVVGDTLTVTTATAAVIVIVVVALFVASAIEVAFSVTVAGDGTAAGALYVTALVVSPLNAPHVAPLHPVPEIDQLTPLLCASFVSVAVKFCEPIPACTLGFSGAIATPMTGAAATVITAAPVLVPSATEVAVNVTVAGEGTAAGAVYVTALVVAPVNVPHVAPLHPAPLSAHVTPLLCASFVSVAVKLFVCNTINKSVAGETVTLIGAAGGATVITAEELLVASATAVAVTVTFIVEATFAGAAYVAEVAVTLISVPQAAPVQPVPLSAHVTPRLFVSLITVAPRFSVFPLSKLTTGGVTLTAIAAAGFVPLDPFDDAHPCNIIPARNRVG